VKRSALPAALLGAAALAGSAGGVTAPGQIRITDLQTSYKLVDARKAITAGSIEIVKQRLFNPSVSSKPIGNASIVCTFLDRRTRSCSGTYSLPRGTLVVAGVIQTRLLYEIAIVGGTGLYDNARGSLTVTSTHLRPRREVLLFRLTG
jgi:hypothetical protein